MEQRRWIRTETVLLTAGLLFVSYLLGNVLLLIFAAIILAIGCNGAAKAVMRKTGVSHGWALAAVGIALFGIIAAAIGLATTRLAQQFQELVQTVIAGADRLQNWLQDIGALDLVDNIDGSSDSLTDAASNIMGQMMTMGLSVVGAMTSLLFLIVLAFFLSADPGLYRRGVLRLVPPGGRAVVADTFTAIAHAVRWWFLGQLGVVFGAIGLIIAAPFTVMAMVAVQKLWVEHTLGEKVT